MYWRPLPSRAPSPTENSGRSRPSIPPDGASTRPVRASTTRAPARCAAAVAASQSSHSWARKPATGGGGFVDDAVTGVAVVADRAGVDQSGHTGLDHRGGQHLGRLDAAVAQALLERARPPLVADVDAAQVDHRVHARAARSASNSPVSGFQNSSSAFDGARRTIRSTRWSVARSAYTSAEPISPEDPAIATVAALVPGSYSPRSASNAPSSSRRLMVVRKRPASAPSMSRWS